MMRASALVPREYYLRTRATGGVGARANPPKPPIYSRALCAARECPSRVGHSRTALRIRVTGGHLLPSPAFHLPDELRKYSKIVAEEAAVRVFMELRLRPRR